MKRQGRELTNLGDGHPRRLSDGRNAIRKASPEQRLELARFLIEHCPELQSLVRNARREVRFAGKGMLYTSLKPFEGVAE